MCTNSSWSWSSNTTAPAIINWMSIDSWGGRGIITSTFRLRQQDIPEAAIAAMRSFDGTRNPIIAFGVGLHFFVIT
jgi:hypothetical protein